MNSTRRRTFLTAGLSALAVGPLLAACGNDTNTSGEAKQPAGGSSTDAAEEAAFPATITHKFGETIVEAAPQRVVCVGLIEQDTLLALGVVPVATTYWFGDKAQNTIYAWARDAFGDAEQPTVLDATNGIPIEKVAALSPDLILGFYSGMTDREFELLSKIAPTVAQSGDYADYGMPWDETTLAIGVSVGQPKAAQALVDDVTGQVADAAAAHPEFAGQTAAVVTPYEGLGLYGPEDPRSRMLVDLGFSLPPLIEDLDRSEFFLSLSTERTSELGDVGAVVWLDIAADKQVQTAFEATAAFEEGRWLDISDADGDYYVAHSFVTPLSIPYVLERYVPQLAAAADGDPKTEPPAPKA